MQILPIIQSDFYKQGHYKMYPSNMTLLYSNFTPRKSRIDGISGVVVFGLQYFIKNYLLFEWSYGFFNKPKEVVVKEFMRYMDNTMGKGVIDSAHIEELHDLGCLPLVIKALPEGTICPIGVPCITLYNTHPKFGWLVNFFETILSVTIWGPMTSATIAHQYWKVLNKYAKETTGNNDGVQCQGHDFSMRGMMSLEGACLSSAAHLLFFTGTDTIPAIQFLEKYYNADVEKELVGASVPATEHSVMCAGQKEGELHTFDKLIDDYPTGILSIVSDTWDLWKVCTEYLPALKDKIMARDGKIVIRPDSGDPVDIICGTEAGYLLEYEVSHPEYPKSKGVVELLWDVFGGTTSEEGYKILDSHIGAIYGDSITIDRATRICDRLMAKGFASTNIVFGIGSYTYQYNTRDTFGFACKATYVEIDGVGREIFKDPITDDGTKRSAKGLLAVFKGPTGVPELYEGVGWETEWKGELRKVFENGKLLVDDSLSAIRARVILNK